MPDIDASIPLRVGQGVAQPINPLTMMQNVVALKSAQQNLLTQRAQAAAGADFQGSIGQDGSLDTNLLNQKLANDPAASRAAIETSQAGQNNIVTHLQSQGLTQEQAAARLNYLGNALGPYVVNGQPIKQKDVQSIIGTMVAAHAMPVKQAAQLIGNLSQLSDDQLQQSAKNVYAMAQHGAASLAPAVSLANNGQQQVPVNTNVAAGPVGPMAGATPVTNQLSPQDLATQVPGQDAQGRPILRSTGQVLAGEGGAPPQPLTPQQIMAQGTQMANQGGPGANAPAAQAWVQQQLAAQGRDPQPAGVVNGPAPGVVDAATATAKNSADQGAALTNDMASLPQQRAALQQVASEINSANPGPLNDQLAKLGGVMRQFGLSSDQATASQLMHKASALNALSTVSSSLGVPTDGKMDAVMAATPNGTMTPEAARAATGMLQGLVDYKQAKGEAWNTFQQQNGPQSFPQFQSQWNKSVPNAAAFQFNHLPAAEQAKYWGSLDKASKQQLLDSMHSVGITPTKNGK